jgi:uncharacterized membrane protein
MAENVSDVLSLIGLVLAWLIPLAYWSSLPESIPAHFNAAGEADRYGSRLTLLIMPAVATGLFALMTVISLFPHRWNYFWRITEENAARQYRLARNFVAILKAELILLFALLEWAIVVSADRGGLAPGFLPIVVITVAAPALSTVFYLIASARAR